MCQNLALPKLLPGTLLPGDWQINPAVIMQADRQATTCIMRIIHRHRLFTLTKSCMHVVDYAHTHTTCPYLSCINLYGLHRHTDLHSKTSLWSHKDPWLPRDWKTKPGDALAIHMGVQNDKHVLQHFVNIKYQKNRANICPLREKLNWFSRHSKAVIHRITCSICYLSA